MRVSDMYNSIKDLLEVNVISEKYNRDLLENTKHRVLGDIAIVYVLNAANRDFDEIMNAVSVSVLNTVSIKQIENDALMNSMTRNQLLSSLWTPKLSQLLELRFRKMRQQV